MAHRLESHPVHRAVAGSIPSKGTSLGRGFDSPVGESTRGNQSMFLSNIDDFLPLSLPHSSSLSKSSEKMSLGEDNKEINTKNFKKGVVE